MAKLEYEITNLTEEEMEKIEEAVTEIAKKYKVKVEIKRITDHSHK